MSKESFTTAGRTGKFSVTNWSPLTGIGLFNADYNVASGEMIITIKVCITFSDFNQKWNDIEKVEWQKDLFEIVSKFWTDRYLLQCTREGWSEFVVQVKVNLELVPKTDAHVDIQVRKNMPDEPTSGGGVGWSATPPLLSIDNKAIYPKDQLKQREAIFNLRMVQMGEAIRDHQLGFIPFAKDSAELNSDMKMKLLRFARYINQISTNDIRGIQLVVYGHTAGNDSFMKIGLGRSSSAGSSGLNKLVSTPRPQKPSFRKPFALSSCRSDGAAIMVMAAAA